MMRAITKMLPFAAAAGIALALLACEPRYYELDLDVLSSPPTAVTVENSAIEVTSGVAVVVHAEPLSGSSVDYEEDDRVELVSENTEVLEVLHGQTDREFAVVGVWPGETELAVKVNGRVCDHIPFRCTAFDHPAF